MQNKWFTFIWAKTVVARQLCLYQSKESVTSRCPPSEFFDLAYSVMLEELDIIHKLQLHVDEDRKKTFLRSGTVDDMIKNNFEGCDLIFLNKGKQILLKTLSKYQIVIRIFSDLRCCHCCCFFFRLGFFLLKLHKKLPCMMKQKLHRWTPQWHSKLHYIKLKDLMKRQTKSLVSVVIKHKMNRLSKS